MRLCSWKDRKTIVAGLRRVYTAVNAETAGKALDELEEQWGNRYPGVIRIWRQAWEEFTPFLKVPARASQGRVHHQRRRKCPLSTTESHQNQGAFPHGPISSKAAAPRRPKHNQQTRRKPRHRHPRLENSPKPTRNPLPQPTKPNPLKTHEPTPSHRRFDKPHPYCFHPTVAAFGHCGGLSVENPPCRSLGVGGVGLAQPAA